MAEIKEADMKLFESQDIAGTGVNALDREAINSLTQFLVVAGIAVIMPLFHNQLLTGPIINALFYIAVVLFGVERALIIALIPSVVALSVGLLPALIFPIVPFIIIGNIIQIISFNFLSDF